MRKIKSLDGDYFDDLYRQHGDPWNFATSSYERAKYRRTLEALGDERAGAALEVGCSIGVLTEQLAGRCDRLIATDISAHALEQARRRCQGLDNVEFRQVSSAEESFEDTVDLVVLSEVVYYWDDDDVAKAAAGVRRTLAPQGRILLVHWLGETDYPKSADDAVTHFGAALGELYTVEAADRTQDYRLDLWRRTGLA